MSGPFNAAPKLKINRRFTPKMLDDFSHDTSCAAPQKTLTNRATKLKAAA
jgi:hypothetical protein